MGMRCAVDDDRRIARLIRCPDRVRVGVGPERRAPASPAGRTLPERVLQEGGGGTQAWRTPVSDPSGKRARSVEISDAAARAAIALTYGVFGVPNPVIGLLDVMSTRPYATKIRTSDTAA